MINRKELIILGRSPFINQLDLTKIDYDRFDVCCINENIKDVKSRYIVSADEWTKPSLPPTVEEWVSVNNNWKIYKQRDVIQTYNRLSWLHYSSDLAVNFAIYKGYKVIYLGGVDLVPDDLPFKHYNGHHNTRPEAAWGCIDEQNYIKHLGERFGVSIYQLNPEAVWLEFRDIGLL